MTKKRKKNSEFKFFGSVEISCDSFCVVRNSFKVYYQMFMPQDASCVINFVLAKLSMAFLCDRLGMGPRGKLAATRKTK